MARRAAFARRRGGGDAFIRSWRPGAVRRPQGRRPRGRQGRHRVRRPSSRRSSSPAAFVEARRRPAPGARHRGAPRRARGQRDRDLRRHAARRAARRPRPQAAVRRRRGPNTGGMGAYSPLPDLDDATVERCSRPSTGRSSPSCPARHAVPRLPVRRASCSPPTDRSCSSATPGSATPRRRSSCRGSPGALGPLLLAAARGDMPATGIGPASAASRRAVGIVLAAKGYPGDPRRGDPIEGLDAARPGRSCSTPGPSAAGRRRVRHERRPRAHGGRPRAGPREARDAAERAADPIAWDGLQRRRDIAPTPAPAARRGRP